MAIHYSGGNFKKVSTGKREAIPGNPLPLETRIHIQGGEGASGAPLFNFQGDVVAIVRSCAKNNPEIRNITPVQSSSSYGYGLRDGFENLFESTEGKRFENKLTENIGNIEATVLQCLGVGGKHAHTRQYSKRGIIESDHFPPYDAYKKASEKENCFTFVKGLFPTEPKGGRAGENLLPAITIPKVFHRKLSTTGSSETSKRFRQRQADFIASGQVYRAINMNFKDYHNNGLFKESNYVCTQENFQKLMKNYCEGFTEALQVHKDLHFISDEEKTWLGQRMSVLTKMNIDESRDLEEDEKVKF